jgi:hypothetical protein
VLLQLKRRKRGGGSRSVSQHRHWSEDDDCSMAEQMRWAKRSSCDARGKEEEWISTRVSDASFNRSVPNPSRRRNWPALVISVVFSASYPWRLFLSHNKDWDPIYIIWYQLLGWHSESLLPIYIPTRLILWFAQSKLVIWLNSQMVRLVESFKLWFPLFRCYRLFDWVYIIWSWVKILSRVCTYL